MNGKIMDEVQELAGRPGKALMKVQEDILIVLN